MPRSKCTSTRFFDKSNPLRFHITMPNQTSILGYEARAARNLWQEFKAFDLKGNMLDLAVAVIIGAAFGQVINSLVQDLIMHVISYLKPEAMTSTKWQIGMD